VWLFVSARRVDAFVCGVEHGDNSLRTAHIEQLSAWTAGLCDNGHSIRPTGHRSGMPQ